MQLKAQNFILLNVHLVAVRNAQTKRGDVQENIEDIIFMPEQNISCSFLRVINDPYFEAEVETLSVTVDYSDSLVTFSISTATISIRDDDGKEIHF